MLQLRHCQKTNKITFLFLAKENGVSTFALESLIECSSSGKLQWSTQERNRDERKR
jgi:hypothetical protein